MRVLFLAHRFPARATRGDQCRAYEHLRHLASRHRITLLCLDDPAADAATRAEVAAWCERVIVVPRRSWRMALHAAAALPRSAPLQVAMYAGTALRGALRALLAQDRGFDLVHLQLVRLADLAAELGDLPLSVDFVDALSLNMARRAACDRAPMRWAAQLEARRLPAAEQALRRRAAVSAVSSPEDRRALGGGDDLRLVGNGIALDEFPSRAAAPETPRLVFVGNLGYFPNVDAGLWLCEAILPRLRRQLPTLTLQLVGARPHARLRRAAAHTPGVELIGPVPRVAPYLAGASVAVAPMRAGSGQQIKILEAMAAGAPVVTTGLAARALALEDSDLLRWADSAEAFAAAVLGTLGEPTAAAAMAARARAWVAAHHTWDASARALEAQWQAAAKG